MESEALACITDLHLLKQGAEAKVYSCNFFSRPTIMKERFAKRYRHPDLDKSLSIQRTKSEVRCIMRCRTYGIQTPAIYYVDLSSNKIYMEHMLNSQTVKDYICSVHAAQLHTNAADPIAQCDSLLRLAGKIGHILGTMHEKNIIHGDLTTSNFLLVGPPSELRLCLIDFGLGSLEGSAEDKAVDLYVLERALLSTHPSSESLFDEIIRSYGSAYKGKGSAEVLNKLEEVRMRGRKRTMVG